MNYILILTLFDELIVDPVCGMIRQYMHYIWFIGNQSARLYSIYTELTVM